MLLLVTGPVNVQNMAKDGLQHTSRLARQQAQIDLDTKVAKIYTTSSLWLLNVLGAFTFGTGALRGAGGWVN